MTCAVCRGSRKSAVLEYSISYRSTFVPCTAEGCDKGTHKTKHRACKGKGCSKCTDGYLQRKCAQCGGSGVRSKREEISKSPAVKRIVPCPHCPDPGNIGGILDAALESADGN